MRGRFAAMAIGAGVAKRRTGAQAQQAQAQQAQAQQAQAQQAQAQQAQQAQQQEIERLKAAQAKPQQSSNQEDVTQKLQKLADLKQKGLLTDEEFQKLKMEALSKL